jgi:hypothetical protein
MSWHCSCNHQAHTARTRCPNSHVGCAQAQHMQSQAMPVPLPSCATSASSHHPHPVPKQSRGVRASTARAIPGHAGAPTIMCDKRKLTPPAPGAPTVTWGARKHSTCNPRPCRCPYHHVRQAQAHTTRTRCPNNHVGCAQAQHMQSQAMPVPLPSCATSASSHRKHWVVYWVVCYALRHRCPRPSCHEAPLKTSPAAAAVCVRAVR